MEKIGDFEIIGELGSGGMARVYLAKDPSLGRRIALKIPHPQLAHDSTFVTRFHAEARNAARLSHPNVVTIYATGEAGGQRYIAMEYVEGGTVASVVESAGALPFQQAVSIATQAAAALQAAHDAGIIHRDVSPRNILVQSGSGAAKVTDFGLSRAMGDASLTQAGMAVGAPPYISPEQLSGAEVDGRSDVYSLGLVLYEMLIGRRAFTGDTPAAVAQQRLVNLPPPPHEINPAAPEGLSRIVMKAIQIYPGERFQSAAEFRDALMQWAATPEAAGPEPQPLPVQPAIMPSPVQPAAAASTTVVVPARRRRSLVGALLVVLVFVAAAAVTRWLPGKLAGRWPWLDTREAKRAIERGQELLAEQKWEEALAEFEQALKHRPSSRNAHYYAGVAHIHLEQWDPAFERIARALEIDPELEQGYERLLEISTDGWKAREAVQFLEGLESEHAEVALIKDTLAKARGTAQHQEESRAEAEEAWGRGLAAFERRQWREAFDLFKLAESRCPLLPDLPKFIGICMYRMHYYADAINRLRPFVTEHMGDETANQHLGWSYIRAKDEAGKSRAAEGAAFYQGLIEAHPEGNYPFLHQSLGTMYFAQGKAFREQAVAEWTLAAEQDPTYARPHVNLGWHHYDNQRYDEALAEFGRAFELGAEEFRTYMGAAATHLALGNLEKAEYLYRRACELDSDDSEARWLLGNVREKMGGRASGDKRAELFRRAIGDYRRVLEISPNPTFVKRSQVEARIAALEAALAPPPPQPPDEAGRPRPRPRPRPAARPRPTERPAMDRPGDVPGTEEPRPTIRPMMVAPPEEEEREE